MAFSLYELAPSVRVRRKPIVADVLAENLVDAFRLKTLELLETPAEPSLRVHDDNAFSDDKGDSRWEKFELIPRCLTEFEVEKSSAILACVEIDC